MRKYYSFVNIYQSYLLPKSHLFYKIHSNFYNQNNLKSFQPEKDNVYIPIPINH